MVETKKGTNNFIQKERKKYPKTFPFWASWLVGWLALGGRVGEWERGRMAGSGSVRGVAPLIGTSKFYANLVYVELASSLSARVGI